MDRLAFREMPDGVQPEPSSLWAPGTYGRYLDWATGQGTTLNGVFGAKLMWGYLDDFAALLRGIDGFQAVSLWKAVQTQAWNSDARPAGEPRYDAEAIRHLVRQLIAHDASWKGYFTGLGVDALCVTYEELAVGPPRLKVQADEMSEDWVRRFNSVTRRMRTA